MLARFTRMAILGVVAVALASCASPQPVTPIVTHVDDYGTPVGSQPVREGGDLIMGLSNDPDKLDPTTSSSLYMRYVMSTICEKLYDNDSSGNLVPQLATALPTISPDGLSVTIPVRTGIEFADGTPFNAAAVKTSLERHLTMPGSQRTGEMGPISEIDTEDSSHVVIRYHQPFAPITAALADRAGMIMSPAALKEAGNNFGDNPVCVGPFKFVKRVPQTSIAVTRDPLYYDAKNVHFDSITYRIMPDAKMRAQSLRAGDIQVADTMSPDDIDALSKMPQLRVLQSGSFGFQGLYINIGNVDGAGKPVKQINTPIARDAKVRQALSLSINREALVDKAFHNWYEPACTPIAPRTSYATKASTVCPTFDPQRSRELLAEAGVQIPYPVTMQVMNVADQLEYAQEMRAVVAEGGFDLKLVPAEYSSMLDAQKKGTYEILYLGWSGRLDPDGNTSRFLTTGSSGNYSGFNSSTLDDLLGWAAHSTSAAQRGALYEQAVRLIQRENPYIYTYRLRNLTVHSTWVTGIEVYADGTVRLGKAAYVADRKG
ncbi:putative peptide ABC transporter substrate-binding protein [Nocardia brasiliensis NBRC 14402]|uniref:ABC transporter substrate-binding protein n=1 Tax=Nocardia brasiliensis TaxID=37326 RepID=UPI00045D0204|nr:ABC transporter substrate-binding protein [Nocardia brasiliensis]ASF08616.1 ABC transporter substrate-binding protein [Nocardia brasiliensis]GAJ81353.1 putative peptide ABC transporter substrate-binding protein [Nocardia brasiliensis NBRC 14402]SUB40874.1 Glutathione-binding protein gsiB precursor [Nocardia brasiliensis]